MLVDGEFMLTESRAITRTLVVDAQHPVTGAAVQFAIPFEVETDVAYPSRQCSGPLRFRQDEVTRA
jgi:hypothetical protein